MNCIIVDDEPLAREAMKLLIEEAECLQLVGSFNSAATASDFMEQQVFRRIHWSSSPLHTLNMPLIAMK